MKKTPFIIKQKVKIELLLMLFKVGPILVLHLHKKFIK